MTVTLELCRIPAGVFFMGDADGQHDEQPPHQVRVDAFQLGRFPVTNSEYRPYLQGSDARPPRFWEDDRFNRPRQPVVGVSWFEAVAFCIWLTEQSGQRFRLPTEAEREWAARGGSPNARYPWGNEEPALVGAWAAGAAGQNRPLEVSGAAPNGFGLCHMGDNVHEWCSDWWDPDYYSVSPVDNPSGPPSGTRRASRGGAWRHHLKFSRCAARSSLDPSFRYNDYGFRVAAELPG
jgi:formylglycine-generating enzyme required for sulfatase activity